MEIKKIDSTKVRSLDFIQEATNREIINKLNEVIDYINHTEELFGKLNKLN